MPLWVYNISPLTLVLIMVAVIEGISLAGLFLARRFVLPRLRYHDGINDAVGGTVQAIGVFYGIIEQDWPAQQEGRREESGVRLLDELQSTLFAFEPTTSGQEALHGETLRAYNNLSQQRRQRVNALAASLSEVMWAVIWIGAAFSISVAYLFKIEDPKLHALLVGLMAGFLAIVLSMVVINDRPFYGYVSVSPEPYQQVLERMYVRNP
jgi:uncharacterized protein YneF (UPF0154 family)